MTTVVQKFGGSSVADADRIRRCAQRAYDEHRAGRRVVVVVSAMGKTTDGLIDLANQLSPRPPKREMDQLLAAGEQVSIALVAMALHELGGSAVSLTGPQCGLRTDSGFTRARIRTIDRGSIERHLSAGRVVVVAGFQGVAEEGSVTTLGRGGSDTTAVALAAALEADRCDIFTDVAGVYTADPRLVPSARKLTRIGYEEMFELAALGAKVMASRAIFLGMKFNVPIHVRHAMLPDDGTLITRDTDDMEQDQVTGLALKTNVGRVTIAGVPARPDLHARLFEAVAEAGILVDDIIQNQPEHGLARLSFTVDHADLPDAKPAVDRLVDRLGGGAVTIDVGLSKVSAVGVGMRTQTGVAARLFRALAEAPGGPVPVENVTTSEIKVAVIVARDDGPRALQALHDAFGLASGDPAGRP